MIAMSQAEFDVWVAKIFLADAERIVQGAMVQAFMPQSVRDDLVNHQRRLLCEAEERLALSKVKSPSDAS